MSDLHLKDLKDELTHEPGWVYLYGASGFSMGTDQARHSGSRSPS